MLVGGRGCVAVVLVGLALSACSARPGSGVAATAASAGDDTDTVGVTT